MVSFNDINNAILVSELGECIARLHNCSILVAVKQIRETYTGEITDVNVIELGFDNVSCSFEINDEDDKEKIINLYLVTPDPLDINKIKSAWHTALERNTKRVLNNENGDYFFTIELVKEVEEENIAYMMSYTSPKWVCTDDDRLMLVFSIDNMRFEKAKVDYVAINDEVEYAEEVERHALEREQQNDEDNGENEDILSNDKFIG